MSIKAVTYCHLYSLQQKLLEVTRQQHTPRITSYSRLPDPASLTKYRPPSQVILQQHPECIDNLLQNMMNAYENFAEIKEQILNITTRGAGGGGGGGGGGDADD